jgi:hypothetical protein
VTEQKELAWAEFALVRGLASPVRTRHGGLAFGGSNDGVRIDFDVRLDMLRLVRVRATGVPGEADKALYARHRDGPSRGQLLKGLPFVSSGDSAFDRKFEVVATDEAVLHTVLSEDVRVALIVSNAWWFERTKDACEAIVPAVEFEQDARRLDAAADAVTGSRRWRVPSGPYR